ncbi:MAG: AI-2E family transporter [Acidimicrobiia bacterium]|nr:AI-2E family transporter [Acidimicrobiia bacterium]
MTGTTERLRRLAYGIWSIVGFGVLLAALIWVASQVKIIWLPLAFAGGLVILLNPIVKALNRVAIPRVIAALFAFVVLGAFVTAIGFLIVPTIQTQSAEFGERLPEIYDETIQFLQETGDDLGFDLGPVWTSETIQEWIQDPNNQEAIQTILGGFGSGAGRLLAGVAEVGVVVLLAPILAFYLLVDLPRTQRLAYQLTPPRLRDEVSHVSTQLSTALSSFVRGQLLVALFVGVLSSAVLFVLDVPFWLIIGMATGFLNLIPLVGPFFGAVLAASVSLLDGHLSTAIIAVVAFTIIQQLDNHVITPMVQRARVHLSPVIIVLALLMGGSLAGLLGVVIAVPTFTALRIVSGHLWRTRVLGESWAEASEAMMEFTDRPEIKRPTRRRTNADDPRLFDTGELSELSSEAPAEVVEPR